MKQGSKGISGRLVHGLEYHYSDGAFGDGSHTNITILYYVLCLSLSQLVQYCNF